MASVVLQSDCATGPSFTHWYIVAAGEYITWSQVITLRKRIKVMERLPPIDTLDGTIQAALSKVRRRRIPVSTPFGDTKPISLSYLMLRDVETVGEFDRLLSFILFTPELVFG